MKKYFKDRMWKKERSGNSLSESFSSIEVPKDVGFGRNSWRL